MKLDREQDLNVLYQVCVFWADRKNKMAALASDWLRHFRLLLWNRLTEFNETWQEARSQRPLISMCFSGRSEKRDGCPGLWSAVTFSTSFLKPLNGIQLYQVCVFWADRKNKIAALASDWLRHFWLLLWNRWTEFNETWQEARSQCPLPSLCFSGPVGKTRWLPWPLIGWDIFDFSSEMTEWNSTKLDRKQDLNILYQVCIFRANLHLPPICIDNWAEILNLTKANKKNKMASLADSSKKVAHCTQVHDIWPFGPLVCEWMFERTKKSPWKLLENVPQKSLKSPWKRYVMICGNHVKLRVHGDGQFNH